MYPQATTIARDAAPALDKTAIGVSPHHHSAHEAEHAHGHHSADAEETTSGATAIFVDSPDKRGLTCHPCCVVGSGPCIAVAIALPEVLEPPLMRSFGPALAVFSKSLQIAPLPHPPKAHSWSPCSDGLSAAVHERLRVPRDCSGLKPVSPLRARRTRNAVLSVSCKSSESFVDRRCLWPSSLARELPAPPFIQKTRCHALLIRRPGKRCRIR